MDIEVIRLECLKMAFSYSSGSLMQIVENAEKLMDFVANGKSEPKPD